MYIPFASSLQGNNTDLKQNDVELFNAVLTKFYYNDYTENGVFLSVNVTKSNFLADLNACTKEIFNGFFCVGID